MSMTHRGKHGFVYVCSTSRHFPGVTIKVGFTESPRRRMYQLQGVLLAVEQGTFSQERELVQACALHRRHPRWREHFESGVWPRLSFAWERMFGYPLPAEPLAIKSAASRRIKKEEAA